MSKGSYNSKAVYIAAILSNRDYFIDHVVIGPKGKYGTKKWIGNPGIQARRGALELMKFFLREVLMVFIGFILFFTVFGW